MKCVTLDLGSFCLGRSSVVYALFVPENYIVMFKFPTLLFKNKRKKRQRPSR